MFRPFHLRKLRRRIEPFPLESPRGYLCRVAQCCGYASPDWITELAGLVRADDLEASEKAEKLASVLRLATNEWSAMAYLRIKGSATFRRRQFFGCLIAADRLNYGAPRICPACLREGAIWWGIWDLAFTSACPGHRCELIDSCLACGEHLVWRRPGVDKCRCGFDLREIEAAEASKELVALNAAVHHCAGFPVGVGLFDLGNAGFPAELADLDLDDLLSLILAVSALGRDPLNPQRPSLTNLCVAKSVARDAAHVLGKWPSEFHDRLCTLLPASGQNAATFRDVYGDFYQYLLDAAHLAGFRFLTDAFGAFVAEYWPGVIRGQHQLLSEPAREMRRWIPALLAAKLAGLTGAQITDLVREGKLAGIFVKPPKGHSRVECWIEREALSRWIARRDADLGDFISQKQAMQLLGLTAATLRALGRRGLIEICNGPIRGFPPGLHCRRQDVDRIVATFSKCQELGTDFRRDKVILLREGLRRDLGRDGLCDFISGLLAGNLRPAHGNPAVPGILGCEFRVEDIKRFRRPRPNQAAPSGFITYAVAAAELGTNTEVVRNLVAEGLLRRDRVNSPGIQLLRAKDVENFGSKYVTVKSLAKRFEVGSRTVMKALKRNGAEVLVIPLPGKGNKLFAKKGPSSDLAIRDFRWREH